MDAASFHCFGSRTSCYGRPSNTDPSTFPKDTKLTINASITQLPLLCGHLTLPVYYGSLVVYSLWFCLPSFQSKRRAPILTAPREDHGIQQTVPENTPAHKITSAGMYPTKHYSEFSNVLTAFHRESKSLCVGTELAVKENKENPAPVGSCRRVGLRKVGLGKSRELPKNQKEFCQTREGIHEKQDGYRPPTVPSYMAGTLSGDVSNFSFITFMFGGL